ncbi:MAG: choice-of-anchor J domain-containing protein, partial [Bacteroidales bacterium]|nr:choice-of-anchor J domain-containing protein [Bacteroidales bacterium]
FPYEVDFENSGNFPENWTEQYAGGSLSWSFQNGGNNGNPPNAHSGFYNAVLFNPVVTESKTKLLTPALDFSYLTSPCLSFWHAQMASMEQDELTLYFRVSENDEWKRMPSAQWSYEIDNWVFEIFVLPEPSSQYFIAFEGTAKGGYGIVLDDVTIGEGISITEWTGIAGNQWFDNGNWSPIVPNASTEVLIPPQCPNHPIVESFTVCQSLTIQPGGKLSVMEEDTLCVSESLILQADASNTASLVTFGTLEHNRFLTSAEKQLTQNRWHYISSPVDTSWSNIFFDIYLKEFHENDSSWFYIVPTDHFLAPSCGFAAWASDMITGERTVYFSGNLNSGDISVPLSATDQNNDLVIGDGEGWNLGGNPYPSAIDWDHPEWQKVNIGGSVYVFDGIQYLTWNGSVGTLTDGVIPAMQAFFVKAFSALPEMVIPNNARLHGYAPYKTGITWPDNALSIEVEGNGFCDAAFIHFRQGATENFDHEIDAYKIKGVKEAPQLYSVHQDICYSINSIPLFTDTVLIALGFETGISGSFMMKVNNIKNLTGAGRIELKDIKEGLTVNLIEQAFYEFDALESDNRDRFCLTFYPPDGSTHQKGYNIFIENDAVWLKSYDFEGKVCIYDLTGRILGNFNCYPGCNHRINCISKTGVYLIHIRNGSVTETVKIIYTHT